MPLYDENESPLEVADLTDADGAAVEDAEVTATLLRSGTTIATVEMEHAGDGTYEGVVPYPLPDIGGEAQALVLGEIIRVRYSATSGTVDATWYKDERVRRRRP